MSVRVDPVQIDERLGGRDFVYVLTVRDEGVHAVAHRYEVDGPIVSVPTASQSLKDRVAVDGRVTLLWPPMPSPSDEYGDFSIVADGTGDVSDGVLRIDVASVLLHRPAP